MPHLSRFRLQTLLTGLGGASAALGPLLAPLPMLAAEARAEAFRFHFDHVMGTSLDVTAVAPDRQVAELAVAALQAEITRLDAVLSFHRGDSELARLNAARRSPSVSPDLLAVLQACEAWRERSEGAFSCRIGALLGVWRQAEARGKPPAAPDLRVQAAEIADAGWKIDAAQKAVELPAGIELAVDGLAKGYILDRALAAARAAAPSLGGLLVDSGGDVRCWGRAPAAGGWRIAVASAGADNALPSLQVALQEGAVATSGSGARDRKIGAESFSHLISPHDGWAVERAVSATVVAPSAADADALATALTVMPARAGLDLAGRLQGVAALITAADGRRFASPGWWKLAAAGAPAPGPAWPGGQALSIDYEIPRLDVGKYKQPYVALWVTGPDKQLVRGIALLGEDTKWAEENYVWWRRYGRKAPSVVDAITRPTRAPGRYTFTWDGRDDYGRPVAPGRYLLHIEAAREHGDHTYQSIELEIGDQPLERVLPAQGESGAVRIALKAPQS